MENIEQVEQESNTQEELSYDELYDKGFDDKDTDIGVDTSVDEEEDLEQPEEESEAETETQSDEVEEETEEETEEDSKEETYTLNYKGQDIQVTLEEMKELSQKGFDYTTKTQDLSAKRKLIELAEEYDVNDEIIATIGEAKKGNKEAFATLANKFGIDPYELDTDSNFKPVIEDKNYELDDTIKSIQADTQNGSIIDNWINMLPANAKQTFAQNPNILRGLHTDTKNGIAQKIMPDVIKTLALNPNADFVETYQFVGANAVEQKGTKPEASREQKKKVSVSKKKVSKHTADHKDVWEDDELYRKMQEMRRR
jgi:hypothetical protein